MQHKLVVVDSATELLKESRDKIAMGFFAACKRLSGKGRAIVVTARPYAFAPKVLDRVELMCDAYLSGREENIGSRMVKMLEVRRANNADLSFGNLITFDIEAGVGIKMVPGTKVRI